MYNSFFGWWGGGVISVLAYKWQFTVFLTRIFLDVSWKIALEKKRIVS